MRIAFFADSGKSVGLGHLSRCAALADAFVRRGVRPHFLGVPVSCRPILHSRGLPCGDLRSRGWDAIVIDSYRITPWRIAYLRRRTRRLIVVDDLGEFRSNCDWILNSAVFANKVRYDGANANGYFLGPRFHPLRREFWNPPRTRPGLATISSVLIALGGGDVEKALHKVFKAVTEVLPAVTCHAIVGPWNRLRIGAFNSRLVLHPTPRNPRLIMEKCQLAISGGGQTLYELASLGIPTIAAIQAKNQLPNLKGFESAGIIVSVGRSDSKGFHSKLLGALTSLKANRKLRAKMGSRGRRLIDGRGGWRVASCLLEDLKQTA